MKLRKPAVKTKKEQKQKRKKQLFISLLIIFILADFVWIMNHKRFKFSETRISGNETILEKDINQNIDGFLNESLLGVLSKNNVLLVNTNKIEKRIENSFPRIYNADVLIKDNRILIVEIEERKPHSLWCKNENYISDFDEECYFADQKGYIYTKAPYFSDGVFEKIYTTSDVFKIGEQVMDKSDFLDFFEFTNNLYQEYNISISRIFVNDRNETRLYIRSLLNKQFKENPYIFYKNTDDYESILLNIGLMLNHEIFKVDWKKIPDRLLFIDLRIDKQIRFKFITDEELLEKQAEKNKKENEDSNQTNE